MGSESASTSQKFEWITIRYQGHSDPVKGEEYENQTYKSQYYLDKVFHKFLLIRATLYHTINKNTRV